MGGKSRVSKQISEVILGSTSNRERYLEPFVGGGAMGSKMGKHFKSASYVDAHPDLVLMWQEMLGGWVPPTEVSVEQYQELRNSESSALRGFVGFGGSFGGKWFGGYAKGGFKSDGTPRNHQAESSRAAVKVFEGMQGAEETQILCGDSLNIQVSEPHVIYCDPPYADTTTYSVDSFDSERFWEKAQEWAVSGSDVFVSEYSAPEGWVSIWEKDLLSSVSQADTRHKATEKLFVWEGK